MQRDNKPLAVKQPGQSLVELTIVLITLLPVLMTVIYGGMSMYQGSMAAEAIKEPNVHKTEMADSPGAVGTGQLLGYSNGGVTGSFKQGSLLDSISITAVNNDTAVMVGRKQGITIPVVGLTFNYTVSQAIQSRLLNAITAPPNTSPTTPFGSDTTKLPPWNDPLIASLKTTLLECKSGYVSGNQVADALFPNAPNGSTYLSRETLVSWTSMFSTASIAQLAKENQVVTACQAQSTTFNQQCNTEYNQLLPHADPIVLGCPQATTTSPTATFTCPAGTTLRPDGLTCEYTGSTTTTSVDIATLQQQINALMASLSTSTTTCATYNSYIYNPPGSPGMKVSASVDANGVLTTTNTSAIGTSDGLYYDPTGKYITPPASMKADCVQRKMAECQATGGIALAQQIAAKFPTDCSGP